MSWKKAVFENFKLIAVTAVRKGDETVLDKIESVCRGGADIVQLRSKELTDLEMFRLGQSIRMITEKYEKLFFVNDRPDLAIALKADGVHVGQDDLPVTVIRNWVRAGTEPFWIGKSTHSMAEARAAFVEEADYIGVGPIYETPTKPHYEAAGLGLIELIRPISPVPFVAIGGIDWNNLDDVIKAGASRVAVVRALFDAENPEMEARRLCDKIEEHEKQIV